MQREITVEEAFLQCEEICRKASSTFFASFSALPLKKRKAVHAVYALCRYLDDIADGDTRPNVEESDELNQLVLERELVVLHVPDIREVVDLLAPGI